MTITKRDLKFIIPFVFYVGFGMWGTSEFKYVEDEKALGITFKWLIAPSIILGVIYSYYSVFKQSSKQALWRKTLALVAFSLLFTLMYLKSSQGYLMFWNAHFGTQVPITVKGTVCKLDYPKRKKILNSYAIYLDIRNTGERINLNVPTNDFKVGEYFEKEMIRGSLGILYSY